MIACIRGMLLRKLADHVVIDVNGLGYDVFLPQFVMRTMEGRDVGEPVELEIYYHVNERQIRPTLIGFNNEYEKQFFEKFISVEDIGPQKAVKALSFSVSSVARAIEAEDIQLLRQLPGIGERTAKKVVATLRGKVAEEALLRDEGYEGPAPGKDQPAIGESRLREDALGVLIGLGHRRAEGLRKIDDALARNPALTTPEDLIREVYRGEQRAPA